MTINLTTTLLSGQIRTTDKQLTNIDQLNAALAPNPKNVDVSFGLDAEPLTLAYQAAIDRINDTVEPFLGRDAIARGYDSGIDVSPEATADRIVAKSTGLFSRFQAQHPDGNTQSTVASFVDVIRGGIEQGFTEARQILSSLGVLEGDIETNVDLTFELTMSGIDAFQARLA